MRAVPNRLALTVVAAVVLSLGASACGGSDDGGDAGDAGGARTTSADERDVRAVLGDMSRAMKARDFAAVCDIVTPDVRKQAKKWEGYPTCEKGMADALTDDPTGKSNVVNADMPDVTAVKIDGTSAVVSAKRGKKPVFARVKKEGDKWLMERWFSED